MCNSSDFQEDWALDNCALGPNCQQTLIGAVLSTQPSHFAIDLRCYIHTGLLCSDLFKINHYKSYLEGNIGFFQLR